MINPKVRKLFPYAALALGLAAVSWAVSFGTLPEADFTFANGDEVRTIDPAKATGSPEGRIIDGLFEGLLRSLPTDEPPGETGLQPIAPQPAAAESYTVSEDGTLYTFSLRPEARWSDGEPLTAADFVWSWRRFLHPETGSEYAYQLYYVVGAEKYNTLKIEPGDRVEVELADRADRFQPFPRGTMLRGVYKKPHKPPEPKLPSSASKEEKEEADAQWRRKWIYEVEVKPQQDGEVLWDSPGEILGFSEEPSPDATPFDGEIKKCIHVLYDFDSQVAIKAVDDYTLTVRLKNPTAFFAELVAFYPLYPVNRRCVEKHGTPNWTKPENIISNGPFVLEFRRIRDRIRMVKNLKYWNADQVSLNIIDALAVKSETTGLNMYINGQADWVITVPNSIIPELLKRDDFLNTPMLGIYFYRINVGRPPLDNVLIRRALNMAIDKQLICDKITKAGQQPARSFAPPGLAGYVSPQCGEYNVKEAKRLLAEAGYPNGKGLPKIQILYNTNESHHSIAELIQQQWKNNLGVEVEMRNLEWATFLDTLQQKDYAISRSGWIADYPDPNTFLDMFVTDGANNQTGWSNTRYDELISSATSEPDPEKRLKLLEDAERILMDEQPIIPIYFYVSKNMVKSRVEGFYSSDQDRHPLHLLKVAPK